MKSTLSWLLVIVTIQTSFLVNNSIAGDKEWRRFGEAAAVLMGIRALTGWDPVGYVVDYPRRHLKRHKEVVYRQPTNVYIQTSPRDNKISAFPPGYSSAVTYQGHTSGDSNFDEYLMGADGMEATPKKQMSNLSNERVSSSEFANSSPNKEDAIAPVVISTKTEGGYQIETKKIWVGPHWEKKIIEGHWRGDTWVDSHTEKRWVAGEWQIVEERKPLSQ